MRSHLRNALKSESRKHLLIMGLRSVNWWENPTHKIDELQTEDGLPYAVYARQTAGEWEYAIVFWSGKTPTLIARYWGGQPVPE